MTKENYEILTAYTGNFRTAVNVGYSRNISKQERKVLERIYNEEVPNGKVSNINCGGCLIEVLVALSAVYNKETERLEKKEAAKLKKQQNTAPQVDDVSKYPAEQE